MSRVTSLLWCKSALSPVLDCKLIFSNSNRINANMRLVLSFSVTESVVSGLPDNSAASGFSVLLSSSQTVVVLDKCMLEDSSLVSVSVKPPLSLPSTFPRLRQSQFEVSAHVLSLDPSTLVSC